MFGDILNSRKILYSSDASYPKQPVRAMCFLVEIQGLVRTLFKCVNMSLHLLLTAEPLSCNFDFTKSYLSKGAGCHRNEWVKVK